MATYAAYRHIELDKVGYSKKRVRNPSSEIINVMCTPPSDKQQNGFTPRRSLQHVDSFNRLFGTPDNRKPAPRRGSLTNQDVTNRNPVTGNGVTSWDSRPTKSTPRVHIERNPVTGETYTIVSPPSTPTSQNGSIGSASPTQNGYSSPQTNGLANGKHSKMNGSVSKLNGNGNAPKMNGNTPKMNGNTPKMNGNATKMNGNA